MIVEQSTFPLRGWMTKLDEYHLLGFTDDEIDSAMEKSNCTFENLTSTERRQWPRGRSGIDTIYETSKNHTSPCIITKQGNLFMEIHHPTASEYTKHGSADGYEIIIPSRYQRDGKILEQLLLARLPWFSDFKWAIYGPSHYGKPADEEIYLEVDTDNKVSKSLYCPLFGLLHGHKELIIKRHTTYAKSYYGNTKERADKYLADALVLLESPEAIKLFKILDKEEI